MPDNPIVEDYSDLGVEVSQAEDYSDLGVEVQTVPEFRNATPRTLLDKLKGLFRDPDYEVAKAQNVYAISKAAGIELKDAYDNYDVLKRTSSITGMTHEMEAMEYLGVAMVPAIAAAAVANPIGTAAGLIAFGALDKAIPTEEWIKNYESSQGYDINEPTKRAVELIDFVGKSLIVGGVFKHAPKLAERFLQDKTIEYKLPEEIKLSKEQVKDIFQTGKLTSAEEKSLFAGLNLEGAQLKKAISEGINISIPTQKLTTIVDKPIWAKIKSVFGKEPVNTKTQSLAGETKLSPSGLIESKSSVFYHQTSAKAGENILKEGFSLNYPKAVLSDSRVPKGLYLKSTPKNISVGGAAPDDIKQIPVNIPPGKTLFIDKPEDLRNHLPEDSEYLYFNYLADRADKDTAREFDNVEKFFKSKPTIEQAIEKAKEYEIDINKIEPRRIIFKEGGKVEENKQGLHPVDIELEIQKKILDNADIKINELSTKAREVAADELKLAGYDYVYIKEDLGSFNRKTDNFIVLPHAIDKINKSNFINNKLTKTVNKDSINKIEKVKKAGSIRADFAEFVDKAFVPLSTRLSKIDEGLKDAIRQNAYKVNMGVKKDIDSSTPFLKSLSKMQEADAIKFDLALKNGNAEEITALTNKYGIQKEYASMRETLDGIYKRAQDAGMDVGYLKDYFPRRIINLPEYLAYLRSKEEWGSISRAFAEEKATLGRELTEDEKAEIVNSMIRGYGKEKIPLNKPGNIKERKILELTPEMNAFYKDSGVALTDYIRSMNDNIEARIFFGKEKNLENSIGNYVARLVDDKIINPKDEESVRQILKAYFDKRGTRGIITGFKNFSYIATMGSPISAVTQIGDLAFSLYKNGFFGTVKALSASDKLTKQDLGLDLIAEEFTDQSKSSKAVSAVFKMVGLDAMDAMGKEALINGAFNRLSAKAGKNDPELASTLKRVFGEKGEDVMLDLKNKVPTDDVKYMLFSELADVQPIALTEMPEYYVKGGNMRLFYMLKSYTIKQFDVYRNEVFNSKKSPSEKAKNAVKLAASLALMGVTADTIKDVLLGRPIDMNNTAVSNIFRLVGFSKWQFEKSKRDGLFETMLETILPPIPFIDDIYKDAMKFTDKSKRNDPDFDELRIWQRIPVVGKFYYWWFGGGQEISNKMEGKAMAF